MMKTLLRFALPALLLIGLLAAPSFAAAPAAGDTHATAEDAHAAEGDAHAAEGGLFETPGAATLATSVITIIIFLALLAVLGKFAWGPIVAGLEKRESKIREDIEAAERARQQADASRKQYEEQLATAETRVRDLMAQAQADGQQLATRIKMTAQEEAEEIKERAMRDIDNSRREAVEQIRAEAATLATSIAEKILRREVNAEDQKRLVEESLDEFQTVGNA